jgi:hypothetical protein
MFKVEAKQFQVAGRPVAVAVREGTGEPIRVKLYSGGASKSPSRVKVQLGFDRGGEQVGDGQIIRLEMN